MTKRSKRNRPGRQGGDQEGQRPRGESGEPLYRNEEKARRDNRRARKLRKQDLDDD